MFIFYYDTDYGKLAIVEKNGFITSIYFENTVKENELEQVEQKETPVIAETARQLIAYFKGELKVFTVPLAPVGTPFMQEVWKRLQEISYGETASYKDIAEKTASPKAYRAVGLANNRNPIPFIIPCHRVIGASGKLVGYGGGLDIKIRLLDLEKNNA